jgi:cytochrome c biogenesis protein CcdA
LWLSEALKARKKVFAVFVAFVVSTLCTMVGGVSAAIIGILLHLDRNAIETLAGVFGFVALVVAIILILKFFDKQKRQQRDANKLK